MYIETDVSFPVNINFMHFIQRMYTYEITRSAEGTEGGSLE
jgi:hypothetical protein